MWNLVLVGAAAIAIAGSSMVFAQQIEGRVSAGKARVSRRRTASG